MNKFDELETLCLQADLDSGAAECHGIITGLICATGPSEQQPWLTLFYDTDTINNIDANDRDHWHQLYVTSLQQLSSDELNFRLLLPDDEQSLNQRSEALTNWCCGFLYGISAAQLKLKPLSTDVNEIITDLTQISGASYDDRDNNNEGETAYMELCEYIRAGAMLIYSELQTPARPSHDDTIVH